MGKLKNQPTIRPLPANSDGLHRPVWNSLIRYLLVLVIGGLAAMLIADPATLKMWFGPKNVVMPSQTLAELLARSPDDLATIDIARVNLLCAQGLSGAEEFTPGAMAGFVSRSNDSAQAAIDKTLKQIDSWADKVKAKTEAALPQFKDATVAKESQNSEAFFRMNVLVKTLQEDLGIRGNGKRYRNVNYQKSTDLFVHGLAAANSAGSSVAAATSPATGPSAETGTGTSASMPVLYVAIGRRLGYPLKLVTAKGQWFIRWDPSPTAAATDRERKNFDATADGKIQSWPDEYYRSWPSPITDAELKRGEYLRSLTPTEELASFLALRGHCLLDTGKVQEAQVTYAQAHKLFLSSHDLYGFLATSVQAESNPNQRMASADRKSVV